MSAIYFLIDIYFSIALILTVDQVNLLFISTVLIPFSRVNPPQGDGTFHLVNKSISGVRGAFRRMGFYPTVALALSRLCRWLCVTAA